MQTSLEHLPEHKQAQLGEITAIIVRAVDPEKVILFGSHATGRWVQERGTEEGRLYEYVSDYDILVITRSGDMRRCNLHNMLTISDPDIRKAGK